MQAQSPHQVLARKWRPRDFDSLVGQDTVVRALSHALDNQRLHHAYLLTGTRGVGKTTIARILAKALNCEEGVSSHPCGKCSACRGVDEGRFPDYLEMDAASNRKVEEMAVVLENAAYLPTVGRYKVFVIDEVHMLSTHAFNAMLKTLEEPPPHVVFVLATTDPQKVPVTVLSRCMQFGLRNVSPQTVSAYLAKVLQAEQIPFDEGGLALIGKAAGGSMRDGLSLLDQAIALGAGEVQQATVQEMLGTVDADLAPQLLALLAAGDAAGVVELADALSARNVAHAQVLMAMASELQRIALAQVGQGEAHELADQIDPAEVQLWYQVAIHGARDLPLAPDAQTGFTMSLLRMLAFRTDALALAPVEAGQAAHPSAPHGVDPARRAAALPMGRAQANAQSGGAQAEPAGRFAQGRAAGADGSHPAHASAGQGAARMPAGLSAGAVPGAEASGVTASESAAGSGQGDAAIGPGRAAFLARLQKQRPGGQGGNRAERRPPEPVRQHAAHEGGAEPSAGRAENTAAAPSPAESRPAPADHEPEPARHRPDQQAEREQAPLDESLQDEPEGAPDQALADREHSVSARRERSADGAARASDAREAPAPHEASPDEAALPAVIDGMDWPELAESLSAGGMLKQLLLQSELQSHEGDQFRVRVAIGSLASPDMISKAQALLSERLGRPAVLQVDIGPTGPHTAAARRQVRQAQRQAESEQAIDADPFVKTLIEDFGATILPDSIKPLDGEKP